MSKRSHRQHRLLRLEQKHQPVLPVIPFIKRIAVSLLLAIGIIAISLFGGMCGYHFIEDLPWIDSFANASMILSGMGPLDPMKTWSGKLFAGCYAIYSGLVVIVLIGIVLAPVFHRMIHKFHADEEE